MVEPDIIKLDFGDDRVLQHVNSWLEALPMHSTFYQGLLFCKDWLEGKHFFLFKTSGSTGEPKLFSVSKSQIEDSVKRTACYFKLEGGQTVFVCLNTQYTGGKMMLARALVTKMKVVWAEARQDPFVHFPSNIYFSLTSMVPSQMQILLEREDKGPILNQMKAILLGGAPVPSDLKDRLYDISSPAVYETFGMTETLSHIAIKKLNGAEREVAFQLLDGVEAQLDERGCLMVRARVTDNEWVVSNDLVEMMDGRRFVWKGRVDNIVNSGGVKIMVEELERLLLPLLRSQGIMGDFMLGALPDQLLGEKLVLYVEEQVQNASGILTSLKGNVHAFHVPKEIIQLEKLPRAISGKLKRK